VILDSMVSILLHLLLLLVLVRDHFQIDLSKHLKNKNNFKNIKRKRYNTFVDKILKHRGAPGDYEYLVQWKYYSDEYNTWEPESSFNDTNCITKYWSSFNQSQ
jgi:hypothetical protein